MFQNINDSTMDSNEFVEKDRKRSLKNSVFANVFSAQYVLIYVVTFMISIVGINESFAPFGISMIAATLGNTIPVLGVLVAGIVGSSIGFGVEGALQFLLVSLVLIVSVFLFRPRLNEDGKNEKDKSEI